MTTTDPTGASRESGETVNITFGVRADDLVPDDLTRSLGITPSHAFARGDVFDTPSGPRQRPFGVWQLRSEQAVAAPDLSAHADYLLSQLKPQASRIRELVASKGYYVDIRIWVESDGDVGSFVLSSAVLGQLCELSQDVNFSFVSNSDG